MLRDEVTDGVGRSIHYASGQTVGELFAGMPKRFPGSPLVPALGKRNGHIAVLGGVVIGLAWNDLMKPFGAKRKCMTPGDRKRVHIRILDLERNRRSMRQRNQPLALKQVRQYIDLAHQMWSSGPSRAGCRCCAIRSKETIALIL